MLDSSTGKTRVLVTHALHFLREVDYIYTIVDGRIVEQGTYAALMDARGAFASHIAEFVTQDKAEEKEVAEEDAVEEAPTDDAAEKEKKKKREAMVKGAQLMQQEERSTGAVSWEVYKAYIEAGNGWVTIPFVALTIVVMQAATVLSSYWLVWWQDESFNQPQGFYVCDLIHSRIVTS